MERSDLSSFPRQNKNGFGKNYLSLSLSFAAMVILVLFVVSQQTIYAQVSKGSVSGGLVDPQGASVPNASIKIVNKDTNETVTVTSDSAGLFRFALLSIGTYRLEISKAGFNTMVVDDVQVTLGADHGMGSISLQIGEVSTTVEVSSGLPLMQTTEAQVTNAFSTSNISSFPGIAENQGLDFLALTCREWRALVTRVFLTRTAWALRLTESAAATTISNSMARTTMTIRLAAPD
jgi:hypothetical protein